jgi:hypothetical protein
VDDPLVIASPGQAPEDIAEAVFVTRDNNPEADVEVILANGRRVVVPSGQSVPAVKATVRLYHEGRDPL